MSSAAALDSMEMLGGDKDHLVAHIGPAEDDAIPAGDSFGRTTDCRADPAVTRFSAHPKNGLAGLPQ